MIWLLLLSTIGPDVHSEFQWPIKGHVTSGYGPRWGANHRGIDISAVEGTWVRAAADGLVIWAGEYGKYGNLVTVRHARGYKTYYAHLQSYCVFKWQRVKRGQRLGRVGTTGKTTGPHLHFEIHLTNRAQDPISLLPPTYVTPVYPLDVAVGGP